MESVNIINKIEGFKKDTKGMSQSDKLHYGIGYFREYEDIFVLLYYIANN